MKTDHRLPLALRGASSEELRCTSPAAASLRQSPPPVPRPSSKRALWRWPGMRERAAICSWMPALSRAASARPSEPRLARCSRTADASMSPLVRSTSSASRSRRRRCTASSSRGMSATRSGLRTNRSAPASEDASSSASSLDMTAQQSRRPSTERSLRTRPTPSLEEVSTRSKRRASSACSASAASDTAITTWPRLAHIALTAVRCKASPSTSRVLTVADGDVASRWGSASPHSTITASSCARTSDAQD
mmetsp:Transcript_7672/g.22372  ORF Transcript_7672/g.22372 Transcript_7672/m.22372 type:complete len:249 (-) Transcript_7672:3-749(-)